MVFITIKVIHFDERLNACSSNRHVHLVPSSVFQNDRFSLNTAVAGILLRLAYSKPFPQTLVPCTKSVSILWQRSTVATVNFCILDRFIFLIVA